MSLIISELSKSFENKIILKDFSYIFNDSGIYAIIGDSGVGKTTLLRMIAGLDTKYSGKIQGGGFKNVSFAFQEYRLFPTLNALDNTVLPNGDGNDEQLKSRAQTLLSKLGFDKNDFKLYPTELSGGMKQRISLVRALLSNKPILLLDEPTKELDGTIRDSLYDILLGESKKRLVIFVSHHMEDIEHLGATVIRL